MVRFLYVGLEVLVEVICLFHQLACFDFLFACRDEVVHLFGGEVEPFCDFLVGVVLQIQTHHCILVLGENFFKGLIKGFHLVHTCQKVKRGWLVRWN